jgi:hypothetical protein
MLTYAGSEVLEQVPPACLALRVVKGVVSVPEHCIKYAMVRQVIGEAKQRGGVKFSIV